MSFLDKLCAPDDLPARVAALPQPVVFTNGVFDILHRGHVSYLAQARALGGVVAGIALVNRQPRMRRTSDVVE